MSEIVKNTIEILKNNLEQYQYFPKQNLNIKDYATSSKTDNHKAEYIIAYDANQVSIEQPTHYIPDFTRFPLPDDMEKYGTLHINFVDDLILTKNKLKYALDHLYSTSELYRDSIHSYQNSSETGLDKTFNGNLHGVLNNTIETYAQIFAIVGFYAKSESELEKLLQFSITRTKFLSPVEILSLATNGFFPHTLFCGLIPQVLICNSKDECIFSPEMFSFLKSITNKGCPVKSSGIINELGQLFLETCKTSKQIRISQV